jgi:hypothetical protein
LGILGFGLGLIFKLAFFGFFLLLLVGLVKRLFWGPRYWRGHGWGKPPTGKEWRGKPHGRCGPWAWHHHGEHWEPEREPADEEEEADDASSEYTGPQE